jgi:hypothetical protein
MAKKKRKRYPNIITIFFNQHSFSFQAWRLIYIVTIFFMLLTMKRCFIDTEYYYSIENATIAIIDTGFNDNEINSNPEYSDKDSAFHIKTYNVFDGSTNVKDENGHGTNLVASLINNNNGFLPNSNLLIIKAVDKEGKITPENATKAIKYACDNKASLINMSFSFDKKYPIIEEAINSCKNKNSLTTFVASGSDTKTGKVMFPASLANVISVASYYSYDDISYSNTSKDINVIINMDNALICKKDTCLANHSSSLATTYASVYLMELLNNGDRKIDYFYKPLNKLDIKRDFTGKDFE